MKTDGHMERVNARLADPQTNIDAKTRSNQVNDRILKMGINEMAKGLQRQTTSKSRFLWLNQITDMLGKATQGIAPCKAGCSHCCKIPALITVEEAEALSKATGRAVATPPLRSFEDPLPGESMPYYGVPCPFLKDDGGKEICSVYANRPFVCRVHYSMDRDNLLCHTEDGQNSEVPFYNNMNLHLLHFMAHEDPEAVRMADIRDFFPPTTTGTP